MVNLADLGLDLFDILKGWSCITCLLADLDILDTVLYWNLLLEIIFRKKSKRCGHHHWIGLIWNCLWPDSVTHPGRLADRGQQVTRGYTVLNPCWSLPKFLSRFHWWFASVSFFELYMFFVKSGKLFISLHCRRTRNNSLHQFFIFCVDSLGFLLGLKVKTLPWNFVNIFRSLDTSLSVSREWTLHLSQIL